MATRVLLVDDDRAIRDALSQTIELADLTPVVTGSFLEARDHITADFAGIIVSDIRMPGRDGFHLLAHAREVDPELPVILLTGEGDVPSAVRGMSEGAFDFLEKPCTPRDLLAVIEKALKTRRLVLENRALRHEIRKGDAAARMLVGASEVGEALREHCRVAARSGAEVLVTGAPGAGTSKVAEVIHLVSAAAQRPFVKLAAAGLVPDMLAAGFDRAEGGTLYLDEVADLPQPAQFALLELLETKPATRLIAGTYRDLAGERDSGRFHPDLYWKLDVMRVRIPALKDRTHDIPALFRHYVQLACEQSNLPLPDVPPDYVQSLMTRDWPGNSRALMSEAMRFAMGLADPPQDHAQEQGLADQMAQVERTLLIDALKRHQGNATETAKMLKLPRKTFYDKLARHGLKPETYRSD
ncbi:sigma-54 dependent transcriptional regulator [Thioclava sp. SK-1]|uniref:sigma-54-dependent transcriptional regulator n=1 Tax=Thioclava sp. SK-1 TaxID=1889770 RepID=UPI00114CC6DB|nr:sigma-54 dependent transcriptional regulator [Thioclava sp. SK-1]